MTTGVTHPSSLPLPASVPRLLSSLFSSMAIKACIPHHPHPCCWHSRCGRCLLLSISCPVLAWPLLPHSMCFCFLCSAPSVPPLPSHHVCLLLSLLKPLAFACTQAHSVVMRWVGLSTAATSQVMPSSTGHRHCFILRLLPLLHHECRIPGGAAVEQASRLFSSNESLLCRHRAEGKLPAQQDGHGGAAVGRCVGRRTREAS